MERKEQYLENLVNQLVGKELLESLKDKRFGFDPTPETVHDFLQSRLVVEIEEMSDETLGRIGAYGLAHCGPPYRTECSNGRRMRQSSTTRRKTTIWDVGFDPRSFNNWNNGRGVLEQLALAVISAAAYDTLSGS